MIALTVWLAASAAQAQTSSPASACTPLPGVEAFWAKSETRFVIFGEHHGTAEIPALFADAVCHASTRGPVIVAVELVADRQAAFDLFLSSDGSEPYRNALTYAGAWPLKHDGRGSQAMMAMLEKVRLLKAAGRDVRIVGFLPGVRPSGFDQNYHELRMANALADAAYERPDARVLALVGSLHAQKTMFKRLMPAAMHLPAAEVLSLIYAPTGGAAWACLPSGCGSTSMGVHVESRRGVRLFSTTIHGFDGEFSPGRPYTASAPAPFPGP